MQKYAQYFNYSIMNILYFRITINMLNFMRRKAHLSGQQRVMLTRINKDN